MSLVSYLGLHGAPYQSVKLEAISINRFVSGHGFSRAANGPLRTGLKPLRYFALGRSGIYEMASSLMWKLCPNPSTVLEFTWRQATLQSSLARRCPPLATRL